ncbi:MAG: thioredoxin [Patescibacteria group bacterium]|jgi:thioredoxin 1|nr:thioredoxin [Patescibacteria group bacterium]
MAEITFTDENFDQEVLHSQVPVLVDFWAPWCGPCKMQGPIIEELAKEMEGKNIKIGKLNVDDSPQSANKFRVMSIPTLMIFKNGQPVDQMIGVQDKNTLHNKLNSVLA